MTGAHLELGDATRVFRGGAGVRGLDLAVASGSIHALVGLNGAGKSTLMRLATGMLRPQRGDVRLFGIPAARLPRDGWARVGHLVEYPLTYGELDGRTGIRLAARLHGLGRRAAEEATGRVIAELGLERYAPVRARRVSLGNRQRLGLAAALVHDPELIVLDEPTNALDPAGVILLRESLLRRAADGAGVLVSSHHLDEVARVADRITVLNDGRVVGELDPAGSELERAFFALVHADDLERGAA